MRDQKYRILKQKESFNHRKYYNELDKLLNL